MHVVYVDDCPGCGCPVASNNAALQAWGLRACNRPACGCHERSPQVVEDFTDRSGVAAAPVGPVLR